MRRAEPDTIAVAVLTAALLLLGLAAEKLSAEPFRPQIAQQVDFQQQEVFPEGWIREFDLKRERTIERLNDRMNKLRRKLERRERTSRIRFAAHA